VRDGVARIGNGQISEVKIVKKVLLLSICLLLTSACEAINEMPKKTGEETSYVALENNSEEKVDEDIGIFNGIVSRRGADFNDTSCDAKGFTFDERLALEIGNAVIKSAYGENAILETTFVVSEIAGTDYYIVTRMPKGDVCGGDYSVAIRKNGEILKIWGGE